MNIDRQQAMRGGLKLHGVFIKPNIRSVDE